MDATAIRADIKTWEHAFKANYQRDPTVEDIKRQPDIAAKYKLYKKLTKEAALAVKCGVKDAISTPPRSTVGLAGPLSIIPKSRPTRTKTVPSTSNPFSPTKPSRRNPSKREGDALAHVISPVRGNTPPDMRLAPARSHSTPSPEALPANVQSRPNVPPLDELNSESNVKKARKRLHGDAVSPSPNRLDKKRRTDLQRLDDTTLPIGHVNYLTTCLSDKSEDTEEANASCIDESPVKVSSNGKDFKLLFEEEPIRKLDWSLTESFTPGNYQNAYASSDKAGSENQKKPSKPESGMQARLEDDALRDEGKQIVPQFGAALYSKKSKMAGKAPFAMAMRSSPWGDKEGNSLSAAMPSLKRSSPGDEASSSISEMQVEGEGNFAMRLLPPSPPPSHLVLSGPRGTSSKDVRKNMPLNRKKIKMLLEDDIGDTSDDGDQDNVQFIEVEEVLQSSQVRHAPNNEVAEDLDIELWEYMDSSNPVPAPAIEEYASDREELEVNLPEDLRNVLHITSTRGRERKERVLVESLLRGTPVADGKHGEVWGIGDVDDSALAATDGEDDWAGEGQPWEVAEL